MVDVRARSGRDPGTGALFFFSGRSGYDDFPGFLHERLYFIFIYLHIHDASCFCTEHSGRQLWHALRWEYRRQTDARQQHQQCRERDTTSWLQCCATCCIAHSCFHRTLGFVVEGRAWTCELRPLLTTTILLLILYTTTTAVCSGLMCVKGAIGTTVHFCRCAVLLL